MLNHTYHLPHVKSMLWLIAFLLIISSTSSLHAHGYPRVYPYVTPSAPLTGEEVTLALSFSSGFSGPFSRNLTIDVDDNQIVIHVDLVNDWGYAYPSSWHVDTLLFESADAGSYQMITYKHYYQTDWNEEEDVEEFIWQFDDSSKSEFDILDEPTDFADLCVTSISIDSEPVLEVGDEIQVSFTIENIGGLDIADSIFASVNISRNYQPWQTPSGRQWHDNLAPLDIGQELDKFTSAIELGDRTFNDDNLAYLSVFVRGVQEYYTDNNSSFIPIWTGYPVESEIELVRGWNLVSTNLWQANNSLEAVLSELLQSGELVAVKSQSGNFMLPAYGYDGIYIWEPLQAYWVNLNTATTLRITGYPLPPETRIPLKQGWNYVSYLPSDTVSAPTALTDINDILTLARDGRGHFYVPTYNFNNIPPLTPGNGYMVHVPEETDFQWQVE